MAERQKMVGLQAHAKVLLEKLSERKRVSQQGLLSALVCMAAGEAEFGIIDIDWNSLRKKYPNQQKIKKKSWAAVVSSVQALMSETNDAEEIAMRSRFTLAQVKRAMEQLTNED